MKRKNCFILVLFLIICMSVVGCSEIKNQPAKLIEEDNDLIIGVENYESSMAISYLLKVNLENEGVSAKIVLKDYDQLYSELNDGKVDVVASSWFTKELLNHQDASTQNIVDLGVNCSHLKKGLLVPSYAHVASISELKYYQKHFNQHIFCPSGIELLESLSQKAINEYKLDFTTILCSEDDIIENVDKAINSEDWILIASYTPHWMLEKYDLRFLEDEKGIFGGEEEIHSLVHKGLKKKNEVAYNIVKDFKIDEKQLNDLLFFINNHRQSKDIDKIVKEWLKETG